MLDAQLYRFWKQVKYYLKDIALRIQKNHTELSPIKQVRCKYGDMLFGPEDNNPRLKLQFAMFAVLSHFIM